MHAAYRRQRSIRQVVTPNGQTGRGGHGNLDLPARDMADHDVDAVLGKKSPYRDGGISPLVQGDLDDLPGLARNDVYCPQFGHEPDDIMPLIVCPLIVDPLIGCRLIVSVGAQCIFMTTTARQVLARNIRKLRKERGWSQEMLAEKSGLHRTYVGDIERLERNVSVDNIEKLAKAFTIPVKDLFID